MGSEMAPESGAADSWAGRDYGTKADPGIGADSGAGVDSRVGADSGVGLDSGAGQIWLLKSLDTIAAKIQAKTTVPWPKRGTFGTLMTLERSSNLMITFSLLKCPT